MAKKRKSKRRRTAKQKAATRKLVARNKRKGKRKSTKRGKSRKKSKSRVRRYSKENMKNVFKGFLAGGGAGELGQDAVSLGTDNLLANKAVRAAVSIPAGWYGGNKSMSGAVGGIINTGVDLGLAIYTNRAVARPGRAGRL